MFATLLRVMSANLDQDAAPCCVCDGDRSAFETLVEKYKQPVVNLVARTIGDFTEAEDIAQHVFVQVYKSAHRYEIDGEVLDVAVPRAEFPERGAPRSVTAPSRWTKLLRTMASIPFARTRPANHRADRQPVAR